MSEKSYKRPPVPPHFTDEHACAIGTVVATWGFVHRKLAAELVILLRGKKIVVDAADDEDFRAVLIANGMSDRVAIGLLKSMVNSYKPDISNQFDKLADKLLDDGEARDIIAHGMWLVGDRPGAIKTGVLKTVGRIKLTPHEYSVEELYGVAERMNQHLVDLMLWLEANGLPVSVEQLGGLVPQPRSQTPPQLQGNTTLAPTDGKE